MQREGERERTAYPHSTDGPEGDERGERKEGKGKKESGARAKIMPPPRSSKRPFLAAAGRARAARWVRRGVFR